MARLRAAIDAKDSLDTGSRPPISTFTTPGPPGTFAGEPATAMPAGRLPPGGARPPVGAKGRPRPGPTAPGPCGNPRGARWRRGRLLPGRGGAGGGRVMTVRGRGFGRKPGDDHVRAELADHAHDVAENTLPVPDAQRLLGILRVAEILRAREVLPAAVHPARGE